MANGALSLGSVLGRYRLDRELGRGGMGVVYLAHDNQLGRSIALKVVSPDISAEEQFRARFVREMRIAAQLEHPNVVPVYEAGEINGLLFIAMRYIEGEDLRALLRSGGPLSLESTVQLATQLAAALDAAHARGLVHRDVKPANVLLGGTAGERHLYLSDFGLAREAASDSGLTNTGNWMGTIDYVAPEQLDGGLISARSDIYAMGCVLFEVVTGEVPFTGTMARKLYAHTHEALPSVGDCAGDRTAAVDEVLARACAKDPNERNASAGDLGRGFVAAVRGQGIPNEDRSVASGAALHGIRMSTTPVPTTRVAATRVAATRMAGTREAPVAPGSETVIDRQISAPTVAKDLPVSEQRSDGATHNRSRLLVGIGLLAGTVVVLGIGLAIALGNSGSARKSHASATTPQRQITSAAVVIKLEITAPHRGGTINADRMAFRGTIEPSNATVLIQGQRAAVGQGIFTGSAALHEGTNFVDVIATAPNAVPVQKTVTITRKTPSNRPPATTPTPTPTATTTTAPTTTAPPVGGQVVSGIIAQFASDATESEAQADAARDAARGLQTHVIFGDAYVLDPPSPLAHRWLVVSDPFPDAASARQYANSSGVSGAFVRTVTPRS